MSEHFDLWEFRCQGDECKKLPKNLIPINPILIEKLEQLRTLVGNKPITINSGYRCPIHNYEEGSVVVRSQHVLGNAADIVCPGVSIADLEILVRECGFDGVGIYPSFIHVDVRSDGKEPNTYNWRN